MEQEIKDKYAEKFVAMILKNIKVNEPTPEQLENLTAIVNKIYEEGHGDGFDAGWDECKDEFEIE